MHLLTNYSESRLLCNSQGWRQVLGIGTNKTRLKYCTSDYFNWSSSKNYAFGSCSYLKKSRQESKSRWSYWIPSKFDVAHHNESFKPKRSSKKKKRNQREFLAFLGSGFSLASSYFYSNSEPSLDDPCGMASGLFIHVLYKELLVVSWKMNITLHEGFFVNNKWL